MGIPEGDDCRTSPASYRLGSKHIVRLERQDATWCAWFEDELAGSRGRVARDYLAGRGLDGDTIARFRLGFAPDGRGALKTALLGEAISEAQLIESGMLIGPDDGGASYDRFRGRIAPGTDIQPGVGGSHAQFSRQFEWLGLFDPLSSSVHEHGA